MPHNDSQVLLVRKLPSIPVIVIWNWNFACSHHLYRCKDFHKNPRWSPSKIWHEMTLTTLPPKGISLFELPSISGVISVETKQNIHLLILLSEGCLSLLLPKIISFQFSSTVSSAVMFLVNCCHSTARGGPHTLMLHNYIAFVR